MSGFLDYYAILEVDPAATPDQLRAAFKKQALRWHPDRNRDVDTTEQMRAVIEAKLILLDPEAREKYDREYRRFRAESARTAEAPGPSRRQTAAPRPAPPAEDFAVDDELLKKWMENAKRQSVGLVAQAIRDFKGMSAAGAGAAAKEAVNVLAMQILIGVLATVVILLVRACKG
jgi:curved DNA-binding protein CbpA